MIAEIAALLEYELGMAVYYGFMPDADDTSYNEVVALRGFALAPPSHDFGNPDPIYTPLGIAVHARADTQEDAEALCLSAYSGLLSMGYTALSPPVSLGQQQGRFEVVAQVEAHEVRP